MECYRVSSACAAVEKASMVLALGWLGCAIGTDGVWRLNGGGDRGFCD